MTRLLPSTIRELLDYDADTGLFTWRKRSRKWFKTDRSHSVWNARHAGKTAFSMKDEKGYLRSGLLGKTNVLAHRIAFTHFHGRWPDGQIDHINGDKSDNRIKNLRDVCALENSKNQRRPADNTSGTIGVDWVKFAKRWRARIQVDGKTKHLGWFFFKEDAIAARKAAEKEFGFHPNHGRAA